MKSLPFASIHFARQGLARWIASGIASCIAIGLVLIFSWPARQTQTVEAASLPAMESDEPIRPIEVPTGLDPGKIALGRKLFFDARLSRNNQLSCSSCHNLASGGADRRARSVGIDGAVGLINAPTVFNSGFNFSQFWDGRAATLEDQIDGPVQNRIEMGSTWPEVIGKLQDSPEYVRAFREVYRDGVRRDHVKDSVAEFERSLATPGSRLDRYLRHEPNALTSREQQGYALFKSFGCASCHQGMNVGGNMYQKVGVMAPYFTDRGHITDADRGRFNVTGNPDDLYMFKVPSLRNVALTAPYFHDGSAPTLADAVRMMAKYQLGRQLSEEEIGSIVDFLKTLTGEWNGKAL